MAKTAGRGGRRMAEVPTAPTGMSKGDLAKHDRAYRLVTRTTNVMNDRDWEEAGVVADKISTFLNGLPTASKVAAVVEAPMWAMSEYLNRAYEAGKFTPRNIKSLEAQLARYFKARNRIGAAR